MSYTEQTRLNRLYKKWLPHNYASLIALKVPFSNTWIRNVRHFRAENAQIEKELLKLVNSAIRKNLKRKTKIREYAKR